MTGSPPRWQLRLENFERAVDWLDEAIDLADQRPLSELEKEGTVQRFEIAWELGWKLMADYLADSLAPPEEFTPTRSIRAAFAAGIISDGDGWMAAGRLRNQLSHTYSSSARNRGLALLKGEIKPLLHELRDKLQARRDGR